VAHAGDVYMRRQRPKYGSVSGEEPGHVVVRAEDRRRQLLQAVGGSSEDSQAADRVECTGAL
jgi:hypothetical protein